MRLKVELVRLRHELHLVSQSVQHPQHQAQAHRSLAALGLREPLA